MALALILASTSVKADIADGQFSINQIFDVQYSWNGNTLNASNFVAPYDSNFTQPTVTAGQYFKFFPSTTTPGTYGLGLYNANGTLAQTVHNTGTLQAIGPDALFYVGSGFFGTVITTSAGYNYGASANFTNMDQSVSVADTSSYTWASTTPLAAGQTASNVVTAPPANYVTLLSNTNVTTVNPTSNNSPPGEGATAAIDGDPSTKYLNFDRANAGFTIKLDSPRVIRGVTFTTANDFVPRDPTKFSLFGSNDGVNWTTIANEQSITLSDSRFTTTSRIDITNNNAYFYYFITFPGIKAIDTYGSIAGCQAALGALSCDSVQIGEVAYYYDTTYTSYTVPTDGGTGTISNPGTAGAVSSLAPPIPPGPQPVVNNSGSTGSNPTGTVVTTVTNNGTYINDGTATNITNTGTMTNNGTAGDVTNTGTFTNGILGTIANLINSLFATNNGTITGSVTNNQGGTFNNTGTVQGATTNAGDLTNTGTLASLDNSGTATNSGTISGATVNSGTFSNSGTTGAITNTGTVNNTGTTGAVTNNTNGTFNNNVGGTTGAVINAGTWTNRGTVTTVNNAGTFTNHSTGTTGAFTNSGTLTNSGTVASLTNSGTATNNGTITGSATNTGTFTNGILGTIANVINSLIFNNAGTISGTITNNQAGTLTNSGSIQGTASNAGTVINSGTMAVINNTGTFTNSGSTGNVTNSGTFNSAGTSGNLTNTGIATISSTGSILNATNSGTLTISDSATAGDINNQAAGLLDFNGAGNIGEVTNAGTFNASGLGTFTGLINIGTANISGTVTTGNINNTGIIHLNTADATIGNVNNTGVLNIATAGGDVTVNEFSQSSPGLLAMAGLQKFNINGPVNLGGSMMIINSPTAFGRYLMINGQPVTGTFNSLNINPGIEPLGSYLKYGSNTVHYYVTPSAQSTRDSLSMVQQDSAKINNLVAGRTSGALGNDCGTFGPTGGCIGFNFSTSKATTGDLRSGNMVISTKLGQILTDHYRVGIFLDRAFTKPTIGTVQYKNVGPIVGGFAGWNANLDGTGLGIVGSIAKTNTGTYIIQRPQLEYAEAGSAAIPTNSLAYQVKASYNVPIYGSLTATPYLGLRHTKLYVDGYTETGAVFPLSIDSYKQVTSDLLGGVSFSMPITENITASVSAGLVRNLTNAPGSFNVTSEIHNMFTFETKNPGKKYTSGALGAGLTYEFIPNHKVGVNVGWQQRSLIDMNVKSFGLNYTVGF
jgi:hypothetical protein